MIDYLRGSPEAAALESATAALEAETSALRAKVARVEHRVIGDVAGVRPQPREPRGKVAVLDAKRAAGEARGAAVVDTVNAVIQARARCVPRARAPRARARASETCGGGVRGGREARETRARARPRSDRARSLTRPARARRRGTRACPSCTRTAARPSSARCSARARA